MAVNLDIETLKKAILGTKYGSFTDLPYNSQFDTAVRALQDQQSSYLQGLGVNNQRAGEDFNTLQNLLGQNRDQNVQRVDENGASNGTFRSSITGEQTGNVLNQYNQQLGQANTNYQRQLQDNTMAQAAEQNAVQRQLESLSGTYAQQTAAAEAGKAQTDAKAISGAASYTNSSGIDPYTGLATDVKTPWGSGPAPSTLDAEVKAWGITPNPGETVVGKTIVNGHPVYATNIGGVYSPAGGNFYGGYQNIAGGQQGTRSFTGINATPDGGYSLTSANPNDGTYNFGPTANYANASAANNYAPAAVQRALGTV